MRKFLALAAVAALLLPAASFLAASPALAAPTPQGGVTVTPTAFLSYGGRITQVAYSPDGRYLAVAPEGQAVHILNATTLAPVANFTTAPSFIAASSLSWGPDSDSLGVGYQGGAVAVWKVSTRSSPWSAPGLNYDVKGVAWSPDGKFLAAGIVSAIYIFAGDTGALNATLALDYGGSQPAGLSWSHDSDFIAVGQEAYSPLGAIVALFNSQSWSKSLGWRWQGLAMDNVAFEGRARFLAVQLGKSRVEVWEVRSWSLFANVSSMSGLENFAWTADGSRLVTMETEPVAFPNQTEDDGGFEVLHLGGGSGNSSALAAAPDGRAVAVGYADGSLRVLAIGGERFFQDLTPLTATTGDPLTFSVRSTSAAAARVVYSNATGGRLATVDLTAGPSGALTATVSVPLDWVGPLLYHFESSGAGIVAPERLVRVSDNDPPVVAAWNFTRLGAGGATGVANLTVTDNIGLASATFQVAIDGTSVASATSGNGTSASFSLSVPVAMENRSVRLELSAVDTSGNGGMIFETVIALDDLSAPQFGNDLSEAGTAGGRIQLGTVATDERGVPTVNVTWRELTNTSELAWSTYTYGLPAPGSSSYASTFPLGASTVAVEYFFAAVDGAGNTNVTATRVQSVFDRVPPEIVVDLSDRQAFQGDPFHLALVARDNIGVQSVVAFVQVDGGTAVELNLTPSQTYGAGAFEGQFPVQPTAGQLTYKFFVTDLEGNTVDSGARTLPVKDNDPPVLRILEGALRVTAGGDLTFHVEATDRSSISNLTVYYKREGEAAYLQQEFTPDSVSTVGQTTAHFTISVGGLGVTTFHDGRPILVYFFALDGALNGGTLGSPDSPVVITVLDGAAPVARFATAGDLVAGSLISFDGSNSDDDLGVVAFTWTIDSVEASNRSSFAWRFDAPGTHTVKLVVRDAANKTSSQTQTLTVSSAPPQTAGVGSPSIWLLAGAGAAAAVAALLWMRKRRKPAEEAPQG